MARKAVKLDDIAKATGVSKATVSRVLNKKTGNNFTVRDDVRSHIFDTAKNMGYRPNLIAQSMSLKKGKMIHVLGGGHALHTVGDIYQTGVNKMVSVIDQGLKAVHVTVDLSLSSADMSELPPWSIIGAVILGSCNPATVEELELTRTPYVVVNGPAGSRGSSVIPDDVYGMKLAVEHLVELGHKKIAYAGPQAAVLKAHRSIYDRHNTYLSEIERYNLSPMPDHDKLLSTIKTFENLYNSAIHFLENSVVKHKATAVVVYGHLEAINLMQAAHSLGLSVPDDVSIIAFCDQQVSDVVSPNLTHIDLVSEKMGQFAAELLIKQIESSDKLSPEAIKVPEQLGIRHTTSVARR